MSHLTLLVLKSGHHIVQKLMGLNNCMYGEADIMTDEISERTVISLGDTDLSEEEMSKHENDTAVSSSKSEIQISR